MVSPSSDDEKQSRRSGQSLLTLRSFVLLLAAAGVVVLWVHNPRLGAAVLGGVTVLGLLAKFVKLQEAACGDRFRRAPYRRSAERV